MTMPPTQRERDRHCCREYRILVQSRFVALNKNQTVFRFVRVGHTMHAKTIIAGHQVITIDSRV